MLLWDDLFQTGEHVLLDAVTGRVVELVEEFVDVSAVVETVREDTSALVHPQPNQLCLTPVDESLHHLETEDDASDVSQIE